MILENAVFLTLVGQVGVKVSRHIYLYYLHNYENLCPKIFVALQNLFEKESTWNIYKTKYLFSVNMCMELKKNNKRWIARGKWKCNERDDE